MKEVIAITNPFHLVVDRLDKWIETTDWIGYEPFDGLSAPFARRLTLEIPILRILLQQGVRRIPFNLRPMLGISQKHSTKAMGYFASGYMRLYELTGRQDYLDKAMHCLNDLQNNYSQGYSGYAWGNSFDYQSRGNYLPTGVPTVVWTAFIGYAFVEAYELLSDKAFLDVGRSACNFILYDLGRSHVTSQSHCISYVPHEQLDIHNANMLAASLLARVYRHTGEVELLEVAHKAVKYTMDHQRTDGSWYYGEGLRWHWVDGYHTGFVLDALYWYKQGSGDDQYDARLALGMDYYREKLFQGAIPKHYSSSTFPIDIQAVAQAIHTFALVPRMHKGDPSWAEKIATWAFEYMQDQTGFFYFRKHRLITNKTPHLHWGQSTMLAALAMLLLRKRSGEKDAGLIIGVDIADLEGV